jgi:hypothetical protein
MPQSVGQQVEQLTLLITAYPEDAGHQIIPPEFRSTYERFNLSAFPHYVGAY